MEFQRAFSGAPWEKKVGYCREIRVGNVIAVTGTIPRVSPSFRGLGLSSFMTNTPSSALKSKQAA